MKTITTTSSTAIIAGAVGLLGSLTPGAHADTILWQPTVSQFWHHAQNWDTGNVPTATDHVTINDGLPVCEIDLPGAIADEVHVGQAGTGSLEINEDMMLNSGEGFLGYFAGSTGTATLHSNAGWTVATDFAIGYFGTGILNITAGADVSCATGALGVEATGDGMAHVTGDGSSFTCTTILGVGNDGVGALSISNGGDVTALDASVALEASSEGDVTVDGEGSSLTVNDQLLVGEAGFGMMDVLGGGDVTSAGVGGVGAFAGSEGTATVSGPGSTWTASGGLAIGSEGTGTLNILNGGAVTSALTGELGGHATGAGTVLVEGAGSTWSVANTVTVGLQGSGSLTVRDGVVEANSGIDIAAANGSNGTLNIESNSLVGLLDTPHVQGGDGTATLNFNHQGASYFFTRNGSSGGTPVALTGSTTVNHIGGGTTFLLGPNFYTGGTNVHQGRIAISGGSINHPAADINIGDESGDDGRVTVNLGGSINNAFANIGNAAGSEGFVQITNGSTWTNEFDLRIGRGGSGELLVTGGGEVNNRTGVIGDFDTANGTASVVGDGSTWSSSNFFFVGVAGDATLNVSDGGIVAADGFFQVADNASSTGTINLGDGGAPGIIDAGFISGGAGSATLNFNHNESSYEFTRDGRRGSDPVELTGSMTVNHLGPGSTTLAGANTYSGPTTIDAGTLRMNGSAINTTATVHADGTLAGDGAMGDVVVLGGTITPGSEVGTLTTGALSLDSDGVLEFEFDGLAGPNDAIAVNGDLVIDGTLNITDLGDMQAGHYTLLTYTGALTDNGLLLGSVPGGAQLTIITSTPGSVVLEVGGGDDCPTDLSDPTDGVVNVADLLGLLANWGTSGAGAPLADPHDIVNVADLLELLSAWGSCP